MTRDTFRQIFEDSGLDTVVREADPKATLRPNEGYQSLQTLPPIALGDSPTPVPEAEAHLAVTGVLGQGGMGIVYSARQELLDRVVAIKKLRPGAGPAAGAILLREARHMGRLEHPNIVPVHNLGADTDGQPLLVMKRVDGVDWSSIIGSEGSDAWRRRANLSETLIGRNVEVLIEVCKAVVYAHSLGVAHLDIKPDNVRIGSHGEVYLMDWGISAHIPVRAPRPQIGGTPAYMAPEMVDRKRSITAQTDVFLLGACLFEVLSGQVLHQGDRVEDVLGRAHEAAPPIFAKGTPSALANICTQAVSREPRGRHPSVADFQDALMGWLRNRGAESLAQSALEQLHDLRGHILQQEAAPAARAFSACHFGFSQALQAMPGHPMARDGLIRALTLMTEFEVTRDNLDHAGIMVDELAALDVDSRALRQTIRARTQYLLGQRQIAEGLNLTVGRRQRIAFLATLVVSSTILLATTLIGGISVQTNEDLVRISAGTTLAIAAGVFFHRHNLLQTTAGRMVVASLSFALLGTLLNRLVALYAGTPIPVVLSLDLLVLAMGAPVVIWLTGFRGTSVLMVVLSGIPACLHFPNQAPTIYGAVVTLGIVVLAAVLQFPARSTN
jgi:eukaryotic-like serine/threonine-protein kinase